MPNERDESFRAVLEGGPERLMDGQETAEREEAAGAYAGESPEHFVKYGEACLKQSEEANREVREGWSRAWEAYHLKRRGPKKEDWQSEIILPDPLYIGQQAKAIVRQALVERERYFEITDPVGEEGKELADLYTAELKIQLNPQHGNLPVIFADACEMACALGQSPELVPVWGPTPGGTQGLTFDVVMPWNVFRDPDAKPRDPWSGMFWIHREWVDYWVLKSLERKGDTGLYEHLEEAKGSGEQATRQAEARERKDQAWTRHPYRTALQVQEFRGVVLSPSGELLLPNAIYSWSGEAVIRSPVASPYPTLKWPGVSFSPMPHLERFEGRGLLEGMLSLWRTTMNLLDLTVDDLNWVVNRMVEIDPNLLMDGGKDSEVYPGKAWWKKANAAGQQAIREVVMSGGKAGSVLPVVAYFWEKTQQGSFITDFVAGLTAPRETTLGETQLKTQRALGVFDSIAREFEAALVQVLWAVIETVAVHWTAFSSPSVEEAVGPAAGRFAAMGLMDPAERMRQLQLKANIQVHGISAFLKHAQHLERLDAFMQRASVPAFAPFLKPHKMLLAEEAALGLAHEGMVVTEEELQQAAPAPGPAMVQAALQAAGMQNGGANAPR